MSPKDKKKLDTQTNKISLDQKLLSGREVMAKLQVNRQTINKYVQAGKLQPIKVSERKFLYDQAQIEDFLTRAKYGK